MKKPIVHILLATYNGKEYIGKMIDSLLSQDYPNIHILVSDDCSDDGTDQILADYAIRYPEIISHYQSGQHFGCAQNHFMHLLHRFQDAPYIMFCDQDDVWHEDKVRKTLDLMLRTEREPEIPVLVHTDLRVVDQDLRVISPSFCQHSGFDGNRLAFRQLLVQNVVTGCTAMINRSLAQMACECYCGGKMLMHDWWLALLASSCGKMAFLNEQTIDYRQHGKNSVGAKDVHSAEYLLDRLKSGKSRQSMVNAAYQAQAFLDCYGNYMKQNDKSVASAFASTAECSLLVRDYIYLKHKLLKHGLTRVVAQLLGL